jgi:hypothetical protein
MRQSLSKELLFLAQVKTGMLQIDRWLILYTSVSFQILP